MNIFLQNSGIKNNFRQLLPWLNPSLLAMKKYAHLFNKSYCNAVIIFFCAPLLLIQNLHAQWNFNISQNTPVCVALNNQRDPRIESDGMGGAFIAWKDYRTGIPDIYVQHIDSNGVIQWTLDGIGACTDAADQSTPSLTSDMAGGIIVTWSDWRSAIERDIYAQRIDANGNILWAVDGAPVTTQLEREHNERIVSDGAGGCIIAFEKQVGYWAIWAQRLNSAGVQQWPAGGVPVTTISSNQRNPKLQQDASGGAYITWQDNRNGDYDVYAQRLSTSGVRVWGDAALQVTSVLDDQNNPKIDPDYVSGGVYICWADQRSTTNNDVYCQRIDSLGNFLWPMNGIGVCVAADDQSAVDLLSNTGINGVIVVWKDNRTGTTDIYAQHLNQTGTSLWGFNGKLVCNSVMPQINPNVAGDSHGGAVIAWQDSSLSSFWNIGAQRIDTLGNLMWGGSGVVVSNATGSQIGPKNISDRNGGSIFVWEDERTGFRDIYVHHIGADGSSIGIEENNISEVNLFPNPFTDHLRIDLLLNKQETFSINLSDIAGNEIQQLNVEYEMINNGYHILIDGSSLKPGVYFVQLKGEYSFRALRVVKQ